MPNRSDRHSGPPITGVVAGRLANPLVAEAGGTLGAAPTAGGVATQVPTAEALATQVPTAEALATQAPTAQALATQAPTAQALATSSGTGDPGPNSSGTGDPGPNSSSSSDPGPHGGADGPGSPGNGGRAGGSACATPAPPRAAMPSAPARADPAKGFLIRMRRVYRRATSAKLGPRGEEFWLAEGSLGSLRSRDFDPPPPAITAEGER
jgi:hypothetical protein